MISESSTWTSAAPAGVRAFFGAHGSRLAVLVGGALLGAAALYPIAKDSFSAVLAETALVSALMLMAYLLAGAWAQSRAPRWAVQTLAVVAAAPVGPLLVQLIAVQGDVDAFLNSRNHVIGFGLVSCCAAIFGVLMTLGAAYDEPAHQSIVRRNARRLAVVAVGAFMAATFFYPKVQDSFAAILGETSFVSAVLLGAFLLAGAWRQTWVPRWVAQTLAVAVAAPLGPLIVQMISVHGDLAAFLGSRSRIIGFWWITGSGATVGLLVTLAALLRERDAQARAQALRFALERETLMRQATDARLNLLQAQIEPHFLLNTLANVQALVETGSPRAAPVFKSLIAYLRASMPQLHQDGATLGQEIDLVRAYLELMLMRMPDRLTFGIDVDAELRGMRFPAMALLTLVENAIHHGIDPSCDGGQITVAAAAQVLPDGSQTVRLWVADSGLGMSDSAKPGVGLANLRARLQAFYPQGAVLELSEEQPHGVKAEIILEGIRAHEAL